MSLAAVQGLFQTANDLDLLTICQLLTSGRNREIRGN